MHTQKVGGLLIITQIVLVALQSLHSLCTQSLSLSHHPCGLPKLDFNLRADNILVKVKQKGGDCSDSYLLTNQRLSLSNTPSPTVRD